MALSLLSVILLQDALRDGQLIGFLSNQGYVRHLVDSVEVDDIRVMEIAKNSSLPLRPLYIFQAKLVREVLRTLSDGESMIAKTVNCL